MPVVNKTVLGTWKLVRRVDLMLSVLITKIIIIDVDGSCLGLQREGNGDLFNGYKVSVVQDGKVLGIGCTTM